MKEIAPHIVVDPEIQHGRPVIQGTRVPVEVVLGQLAAGLGADEVAATYGVTREDVLATIRFAATSVKNENFRAVS
jgi:uncharacterized protein (DUF433 family)